MVLRRWLEEEETDEAQHREEAQVTAVLLGRALRVFARAEDSAAIEALTAMLVYEPSLTPTVVRYARRCISAHRRAVESALDQACNSGVLSAWQAVWVAYLAGEIPRRRRGVREADHIAWLRRQVNSSNSAIAAEPILALARRRLATVDEVNAVVRGLTPVQRPTGILALAAVGGERLAAGAAPSQLDRFRAAWAVEHL